MKRLARRTGQPCGASVNSPSNGIRSGVRANTGARSDRASSSDDGDAISNGPGTNTSARRYSNTTARGCNIRDRRFRY